MINLSIDTCNKISFLSFKSLIIDISINDISSIISSYEMYKELLNAIDFTIYNDRDFFLLNNYMTKTQGLIRQLSCKFNSNGKVREKENELIGDINRMTLLVDKEERIEQYYLLERGLRMNMPITTDDILQSVAGDYNVVVQLLSSVEENKKLNNISCRQFLESTAFFLSSISSLYEECPLMISKSYDYLEEMPKVKDFKLRKNIYKVKKELKTF